MISIRTRQALLVLRLFIICICVLSGYLLVPKLLMRASGYNNYTPTSLPIDAPLLSFSVLSDVHIAAWDQESHRRFREALADHANLLPNSQLLVLNGDLTNGAQEDYITLKRLINEQPHAPIHATMGNHEYYEMWRSPGGGMDTAKLNSSWSTPQAVLLFTQAFGYTLPYHDQWIEGFHFIYLSGEAYRDKDDRIKEDAYLSATQLQWLKEKLQKRTNKPTFVFLHQPLPSTVDGSEIERGVVQEEELRSLLNKQPNTFLFSGHTHWDLAETKQIKQSTSFITVGSSSIRQVFNARNEPVKLPKSQSLIVKVYKHHIEILGREHSTKQWITYFKQNL
jgi:3',5'-cyclic-AMP phosphodiesterase